ncbi:MAG: peptidoglycan DD-metalloendopeptidase family protein [Mariprofundus sp.]|nr:peptidoglycan DD-metalloendopeptidase family protein [Mariprofundus sp.]
MKQQRPVSVSLSGGLFGLKMNRKLFAASTLLLAGLVVFGIWGVYGVYQSERLSSLLQETSAELEHVRMSEHSHVADLNRQLQAEQDKLAVYARTLGQMQARMSRLDALGARLVDVASLDKSEFDFGLEPAFGGHRSQLPVVLDAEVVLGDQLFAMDKRLKQLDVQLASVDYLLEKQQTLDKARPHIWPTEGGWISSRFGQRIDPFTGSLAYHFGVDIANHYGAPVIAASHGVVTFADKMVDFGYVVDVEHGYGYKTRYAHMSSLSVKVGDVVNANQELGRIGSTGHSTGPHLHYEVSHYGKLINPGTFLPRS